MNKILNFGNPVRQSLKTDNVSKKESREFFGLKEDVFTILIVGGSLGAPPINKVIYNILSNSYLIKELQQFGDNCQFIWQTGSDCRFTEFYKTELEDTEFYLKYCSVHKFIDRMDLAYNAADIVISRAGAIVISEICFLSKASILIPSPYVTANHQEINAEYLGINNACIVLLSLIHISEPTRPY